MRRLLSAAATSLESSEFPAFPSAGQAAAAGGVAGEGKARGPLGQPRSLHGDPTPGDWSMEPLSPTESGAGTVGTAAAAAAAAAAGSNALTDSRVGVTAVRGAELGRSGNQTSAAAAAAGRGGVGGQAPARAASSSPVMSLSGHLIGPEVRRGEGGEEVNRWARDAFMKEAVAWEDFSRYPQVR